VNHRRGKIEARQDAQAKRLLDGGRFALIILGGAHDLSDNLDRLSGGKAEYVRVATREWREVAEDVSRTADHGPRPRALEASTSRTLAYLLPPPVTSIPRYGLTLLGD
jgi:hypothetical protein